MKKNITRILALLLALCMAFSLVSCKKSKKKPAKKDDASSTVVSDETPSTDDVIDDTGDLGDDFDDDYYEDNYTEPSYSIVVDRPESTGSISTGEKLEFTGEDIDFDDIDNDIDGDDFEDIDDEETEISSEPFVQPYGAAVSGGDRKITVENTADAIVCENTLGTGCNFYPTWWSYTTQLETATNKGSHNFGYEGEISAKRYNDIHGSYGRSWFNIDWMITNEAGDDYDQYKVDWESNPDYVNYMNGVYSLDNDMMQSVYRYYRMLEEAEMDIEVSFGWKLHPRIHEWFACDLMRANNSAPRDIFRYADAASEFFKYCYYKEGLRNVTTITFYNEPGRVETLNVRTGGDYRCIGDSRVHWANMMKEVVRVFNSQTTASYENGGDPDGFLKTVQIWGAENTEDLNVLSDNYITPYLNLNYADIFDAFTMHVYYYPTRGMGVLGGGDAYLGHCQMAAQASRFYTKPLYVTENYCSDKDTYDGTSNTEVYKWDSNDPTDDGWKSSYSSYFIASTNNGIGLTLDWGFTGGYLPTPTGFDPAGGTTACWFTPNTEANAGKVQWKYYLYAMRNNYIPRGADAHSLSWTGDDIRASAFTKDNDFALYIEANEHCTVDRVFNVSLKQSIGANRKLYVYIFNYDIEKTANATIPPLADVVTVQNGRDFTYGPVSRDYGVYLFSTVPPLKQVEIVDAQGNDSVLNHITKGQTVTLKANLIDADPTDTVTWKVSSYAEPSTVRKVGKNYIPTKQTERDISDGTTDDIGTVTQTADGLQFSYTTAADAQVGDIICVRGTINGTNGKRFAVAAFTVVS